MAISLTEAEVAALNSKYIHSVDKFFRMFTGTGSQLLAVKDDSIYLKNRDNGEAYIQERVHPGQCGRRMAIRSVNYLINKSKKYENALD